MSPNTIKTRCAQANKAFANSAQYLESDGSISLSTEFERAWRKVTAIPAEAFEAAKLDPADLLDYRLADKLHDHWANPDYLTTAQAAKVWGISQRRVNAICSQPGRVPGLKESVSGYLIPIDYKPEALKPGPKPKG